MLDDGPRGGLCGGDGGERRGRCGGVGGNPGGLSAGWGARRLGQLLDIVEKLHLGLKLHLLHLGIGALAVVDGGTDRIHHLLQVGGPLLEILDHPKELWKGGDDRLQLPDLLAKGDNLPLRLIRV